MKYVRYTHGATEPRWGIVREDIVEEISDAPFHSHLLTGARHSVTEVRVLAPVESPSKIVCFGKNYGAHVREMGWEIPREPVMFLKPPSAVVGPGDAIVLPETSGHVEPEGELVVIIGKPGKNIAPESALDHVFGYTIGNDVSARDLMANDGQWARAKGYDSFLPLGPSICTNIDPAGLAIRTTINEVECQIGTTADMIRSVPELIAMCSSAFTLNVGDVILTGSPAGRARLADGQTVQITIDGLGTLSNSVEVPVLSAA